MQVKICVIKSVLVPVLLWGSEACGLMRASLLRPVREIQEKAVRWVLGKYGKRLIGGRGPAFSEFNLESVDSRMARQRIRLFVKALTLNSWIKDLLNSKTGTREWTRLSRTSRWVKKHALDLKVSGNWRMQVIEIVEKEALRLQFTCNGKVYLERSFTKTRSYVAKVACQDRPGLQRGKRRDRRGFLQTRFEFVGDKSEKDSVVGHSILE